jgi:hypothetical protein
MFVLDVGKSIRPPPGLFIVANSKPVAGKPPTKIRRILMQIGVDRYGRKIQLTDDKGLVPARERTSIRQLFEEDQKKSAEAQKTDVVDDQRETVVVDANDDINKFLKQKGKDKPKAQDADLIYQFSTNANDQITKLDSEQKKELKTDPETGKPVESVDERGEYVSENAPDDKSAFEGDQKKTQKAAEKKVQADANIDAPGAEKIEKQKKKPHEPEKASGGAAKGQDANPKSSMSEEDLMVRLDSKKAEAELASKVKGRWAKTIASILFDPFQLDGKKAVAFKIGKDAVLMPSLKPTRTEWMTARSIIDELRDPSILRTAQLVESVDIMDDAAVPDEVEGEKEEGAKTPDEIESEIQKDEKKDLAEALKALDEGDIEKAKELIKDVIGLEKKEDVEEKAEAGEEGAEVKEEKPVKLEKGEVPEGLKKE